MQSAKSWHGYGPTPCIGIVRSVTTRRSSLLQREMRSIFMVVPDVFVHQPFQMLLIHHDHMVDQITTAVANQALGSAVLPRTSEAGPFGLDAEALHCVDHLLIEVCCAVEDQVTGERIVWKGLTQLLNDPRASRVFGDAAAQNSAPIHARSRRGSTARQRSASAWSSLKCRSRASSVRHECVAHP